ncbi:MAG TPA: PadR family transcriptional regulator [Xanthobacteraceae bacterium]|nr:PadR family transcriptional regulator [Xanthobacteraceae bacterium]
MKKAHPANPLALAVLALLFERPMHPYEMASTMKQRHKEESIKLRYGSLYTVIELLLARGFIRAKETSREGRRPERTVYAMTAAGYEELMDWMRDLIRDPVKEFPQFEAGLCLIPVLPPDEALALLQDRATKLVGQVAQLETQLAHVAQLDWSAAAGTQQLPPALKRIKKFPPLFTVEGEYRLAMLKAEQAFVAELIRRIVDEGWGPLDLWRAVQADAARQHEKNEDGEEEAST